MKAVRRNLAFLRQALPTGFACVLLASCGLVPSFNAGIELSGRVEDQDGKPLEQVRLHVRESRFSLASESFLASDESVLELEDGRFRVDCGRCSGVRLHFAKDGYYSETFDFHVEKAEEGTGRLAGDNAQDLVRTDLVIVLRSDRNKAELVRYQASLTSAPDGPVRVAPLRRDLGSAGVLLEHLSNPPSKKAQILPGYVRLLPTLDDAGALAAQPLPDVPGARMRLPAPAVLDFSHADGGAVLHRFIGGDPARIYREMRTAPAEGYQTTLDLDTAKRDGIYFFFCRFGDRYGKGLVAVPSFGHAEDGREVVVAYVELRINLDGSRNVETDR